LVSLSDIESLSQAALRVDTNPIGLAGRLVGLSADEQRAGVPGVAWLGIGLAGGIIGGIWLSRTELVKRLLG
jgi:hypothetical protein